MDFKKLLINLTVMFIVGTLNFYDYKELSLNECLYNQIFIDKTDKNIGEDICITILNKKTITIKKDRITEDILGFSHLDNRWNLDEVDDILDSIKGVWFVDSYVGFVTSSIYYSDLFDKNDNLEKDIKERLEKEYDRKVSNAKKNIPDLYFSIKEHNNKDTNSNYIYVNDQYSSPISIILSLDRLSDNYPIFVDQTTISTDFLAEYPILYIKLFIKCLDDNQMEVYEPATLVITADNRFYILIDGAFYSLKNT